MISLNTRINGNAYTFQTKDLTQRVIEKIIIIKRIQIEKKVFSRILATSQPLLQFPVHCSTTVGKKIRIFSCHVIHTITLHAAYSK